MATGARKAAATGWLGVLARLNPTGVFLGTLAVVLLGLLIPGTVGGVILLVLAAALIALAALTWSVGPPAARAIRLIMLAILIIGGLAKIY